MVQLSLGIGLPGFIGLNIGALIIRIGFPLRGSLKGPIRDL